MKLQIRIDGKAYEVDVEILEDEESPPAPSYLPYRATHSNAEHAHDYAGMWDAHGKVCRSPVTGLVIEVNVQAGQHVGAGELILVLEAMKMETKVTAPHTGIVKSVLVAPGDSVKLNQVLLECE